MIPKSIAAPILLFIIFAYAYFFTPEDKQNKENKFLKEVKS